MILNRYPKHRKSNPYLKLYNLLIQAAIFAFLITFYNTSQSFWSCLLKLEYQLAFIFNFVGGFVLGVLIGMITHSLDKLYPWDSHFQIRVLIQSFFGIFLVLIVAFVLSQGVFALLFKSDLRSSDYFRSDFVILIVSVCFINMHYLMLYVFKFMPKQIPYLNTLSLNEKDGFVFFARIAYFELDYNDKREKCIKAFTWEGHQYPLLHLNSLQDIEKKSKGLFVRVRRDLLVNRLTLVEDPVKIGNNRYKIKLDLQSLNEIDVYKKDVSALITVIEENTRHFNPT